MRTSASIAIGLFIAVAVWLASGYVIGGDDDSDPQETTASPKPILVEVRQSTAEMVRQYTFAQGVAEPFRISEVTAATGGTVAEVPVSQGDQIEEGAIVARISPAERGEEVLGAEANVQALEADLRGIEDLAEQGFATASRVRELEAQLQQARAALAAAREEISDTTVESSISGTVSAVFVNDGQVAPAGTAIARVVDNSPLRVTVNVSQRDVGRIDVGGEAVVSFATGDLANGRICFVAPMADPETRTFQVEIRVPNQDQQIPSLVSTEVRMNTGETEAHLVSPAILTLSDAGALGVKSIDDSNRVRFHPVEVIRAGTDGVWVSGLPEKVQLISTGQGFVRDEEKVRIAEADSGQGGSAESASPEAEPAQDAPLPTSTVKSDPFAKAEKLPKAPAVDELCELQGATALNAAAASRAIRPSSGGVTAAGPMSRGATGGATTSGIGVGSSETQQASPEATGPGVTPPAVPSPPVGASPGTGQPTGTSQPSPGSSTASPLGSDSGASQGTPPQ